jgi:hypothetical protein
LLRAARLGQFIRQRIALLAHGAQSLCHRQLARHLARVELGFECMNLGVFGRRSFLQRVGYLCLGQGNRVALFPLGQLEALVQLLLKRAIAHLLEDVGIPSLVDLEGFAAVGADDFVHGRWGSFLVGLEAVGGLCHQATPYIFARRVNASRAPSKILQAASLASASSIEPRATILL